MTAEAKSSKGVAMYLSKGAPAMSTVVPTAISKADPAVVDEIYAVSEAQGWVIGQTLERAMRLILD